MTELCIRGRMPVSRDGKRIELPRRASGRPVSWPEPRASRNLRWQGGTYPRIVQTPNGEKMLSEDEYKKQFQKGIDDSIELEKRDR